MKGLTDHKEFSRCCSLGVNSALVRSLVYAEGGELLELLLANSVELRAYLHTHTVLLMEKGGISPLIIQATYVHFYQQSEGEDEKHFIKAVKI